MPQNIETRAEQTDDPLGLTGATAVVEELRSSVDSFREQQEERQQQLAQRLEQIETRLNRPGIQTASREQEGDLEMRAFVNFARHGREALSADEQRALATDGATAGATLVPDVFLAELVRNL